MVDTTAVIATEQGEVSGKQRLTPIQQWFFSQSMAEPHHYNQTTMVSVSGRLQPELLKRAVGALLRHHDVLRLRFDRDGEDWKAHYAPVSSEVPLTVHDLSGVAVAAQRGEIERLAAAAQSSLDLSAGPLLRCTITIWRARSAGVCCWWSIIWPWTLCPGECCWKTCSVVMSSWSRVLARCDCRPRRPAYQEWAAVLQEYAQSPQLLAQIDYWLDDKRREVAPLPTDFSDGENLESTTRDLSVTLNVEETQKLVFEVSKAGNVQVNEVLLTVLAETLSQWTG